MAKGKPLTPELIKQRNKIIRNLLSNGAKYKEILAGVHEAGLGCSTHDITLVKRGQGLVRSSKPKRSGDPIMSMVEALRSMGVIEFHYAADQVVVIRKQTLEIK